MPWPLLGNQGRHGSSGSGDGRHLAPASPCLGHRRTQLLQSEAARRPGPASGLGGISQYGTVRNRDDDNAVQNILRLGSRPLASAVRACQAPRARTDTEICEGRTRHPGHASACPPPLQEALELAARVGRRETRFALTQQPPSPMESSGPGSGVLACKQVGKHHSRCTVLQSRTGRR